MRKGKNIYKRKDGRWEGRFKNGLNEHGRTIYKSIYGDSYTELKNKMGTEKPVIPHTVNKITVYEITMLYLNNTKENIKESTYARYYNITEKHIIPFWKNKKAVSLTNQDIQNFIDTKKKQGLKSQTIKNILSLLLNIYRFAEMKELIPHIELIYKIDTEKPERIKVFSMYNQTRIIQHIQQHMTFENVGVYLALFLGVRIGEICALTVNDIDFNDKTLRINKTIQRIQNTDKKGTKIIIDEPKSPCSIRAIPIPDFIIDILIALYKGLPSCYYLLTGHTDYIEPRNYQYKYQRILNACKVDYLKFHTLRHTFATNCIAHGMDIKVLSEILGHASVRITYDRYVHPAEHTKKDEINKVYNAPIYRQFSCQIS